MYCVGWSKLRVRRPQEGGECTVLVGQNYGLGVLRKGGMYCVGWSKLRVQRPQ